MKKLLIQSNDSKNKIKNCLYQVNDNKFEVTIERIVLTRIKSMDEPSVMYKGSSIHEALKVFKRESKTIYFDDLAQSMFRMKSNKFKQVYRNNYAINKLKKEN